MGEDVTLRVLDIIPGTSVDGPGLRTSIYLAGCAHQCPGCHNPQSWDFNGGQEMTVGEIVREVDIHGFNVTFSGGDPIYQYRPLTKLAEELYGRGYAIWCYTGFRFEELRCNQAIIPLLEKLEVVVDGPFIEDFKDTSLLFRGSANQRLIDVMSSLSGEVRLWVPSF